MADIRDATLDELAVLNVYAPAVTELLRRVEEQRARAERAEKGLRYAIAGNMGAAHYILSQIDGDARA